MAVRTSVTETPVAETVSLRQEHVTVERRPVDRQARPTDGEAFKEQTIKVTEMGEEAVVSKQARVVEEVVLRKEAKEHTETIRDTVRRTDVQVDQTGTAPQNDVKGFEVYDADFRRHYGTAFATKSGSTYERYMPAYRYGYTLVTDKRYIDRDWTVIEPEVRRSPGKRAMPGPGSSLRTPYGMPGTQWWVDAKPSHTECESHAHWHAARTTCRMPAFSLQSLPPSASTGALRQCLLARSAYLYSRTNSRTRSGSPQVNTGVPDLGHLVLAVSRVGPGAQASRLLPERARGPRSQGNHAGFSSEWRTDCSALTLRVVTCLTMPGFSHFEGISQHWLVMIDHMTSACVPQPVPVASVSTSAAALRSTQAAPAPGGQSCRTRGYDWHSFCSLFRLRNKVSRMSLRARATYAEPSSMAARAVEMMRRAARRRSCL